LPAGIARRLGDGAHTPDIRREGSDGHAAGRFLDDFQALADGLFRRRLAFPHRIGGITDQRQHAGIAELPQPRLIGRGRFRASGRCASRQYGSRFRPAW
jgi:hypothetical protein